MRSFERIIHHAVAVMFICLSICPPGTAVHCDHTMLFSADLILWLHNPVFWVLWHQRMSTYSQPSFPVLPGAWICKLGVISPEWFTIVVKLLLSANRKSYMPRRLVHQRISRTVCAVAQLLVQFYMLSTNCFTSVQNCVIICESFSLSCFNQAWSIGGITEWLLEQVMLMCYVCNAMYVQMCFVCSALMTNNQNLH